MAGVRLPALAVSPGRPFRDVVRDRRRGTGENRCPDGGRLLGGRGAEPASAADDGERAGPGAFPGRGVAQPAFDRRALLNRRMSGASTVE